MKTRRVVLTTTLAAVFALAPMGTALAGQFPDTVPLPNGWLPEGIATGTGTTIYAGSRADGSVWKGDLRTGEGEVLVDGDGRVAVGLKVNRGLLFVSGGGTGDAYVYDARTGEEIVTFDLTDGPAFINDVIVTRDAAYFTNSRAAELYRVALGPGGVPTGDVQTLPLTGDWRQVANVNNANGIAATPDGGTLLVINSETGTLYNVDPATGEAVAVDTGGTLLTQGDGILLQGSTLYVVRNQANQVVELRMSPDFLSATFVDSVTDPDFDVPTTIARQGSRLYVVNARFGTTPTPETAEYDIVLVDGR
jgi:sugar lactone lactonase YvrE